MKESEKAGNNINARLIIANVLNELGMNAPSFSQATGISYMRVFDLQRGRTKKFNPGVVNIICETFPQIRKEYLYTGEGPVTVSVQQHDPSERMKQPSSSVGDVAVNSSSHSAQSINDVTEMFRQLIEMSRDITSRASELDEQRHKLLEKEHELNLREVALERKELEMKNFCRVSDIGTNENAS